ncbi:MAG: DegT/DnrJ/EryC1/StrS aminotransferase family protein, partial [Kordiimonadaceae bacterium]|nr:DegT/DnrJ/EryC1/StrS aminotransferase family protein [Kordiimonadaceae bacterium]
MISHSRPWINKEDKTNILSVLQSELLISGKQVQSFRTNLQNISGFNEIRLTYSGQRAIELALSHIAVKTNKRDVILPTYVCSEVYEAILSMGFNPVLCDVGTNWIMTKETVQNHLDHNTAAIILISVFGIDVDANDFKDFDCFIINDLCQNFDDLIKKRSYYGDFITV